ncbi:LarC family nickel insertion protein [Paenibacillus ferrarius]|uniref:LarC family nickel insertion protein n=1 Tax=Paenibacillus ferrarius TaxID=1469647 RepID=UPI003D292C60
MRILYLDCFSGISGDMTLGALVDAGADRAYIEDELSKIKLEPYSLDWKRVIKRGISATKLDVVLDPEHPPKHHRHYSEIVKVIREAKFSDRATALSLAIFEKIAIAEAKIHGTSIEKVHFHEVGAIDSIVDIVGVALAIDSLHIERICASPVPLGSGTIHIDHGIYPVPAPATLEMMVGVPIASTPYTMEMTTPTGAGIIAGIVDEFSKSFPPMVVDSIGYGAGTRDLPKQPNVLRVVVGQMDPYIGKWQLTHEHLAHDHSHEHAHEDHHHHHSHDHHDHHHHHEHAHGDHKHEHDHHHHDHDHDHDHTHHHDHDHHDHKHEHVHTHHHHDHSH